jgi:hypothetical protein
VIQADPVQSPVPVLAFAHCSIVTPIAASAGAGESAHAKMPSATSATTACDFRKPTPPIRALPIVSMLQRREASGRHPGRVTWRVGAAAAAT